MLLTADALCTAISLSFVSTSFSVEVLVAVQHRQMLGVMSGKLRLNALKYVNVLSFSVEQQIISAHTLGSLVNCQRSLMKLLLQPDFIYCQIMGIDIGELTH